MRICQIELHNFRGVKYGCVTLPKHTVLMGANNAGKTTIAEALTILFGRERMVRPISDWDFYGGSPKPDTRFYIIATITDFGGSEMNDPTEFPDWFVGEKAARPVWWREGASTVSVETDPPEGTLLAAQIALAGCYDDEACEFETIRYFYHGECDPFSDGCDPVPPRVLRELGVFLLSSNREWDKLLSFGSSTFLKVVREYGALPGKTIDDLKDYLRSDVPKIEDSYPLSEILEAAEKELQSFLLIEEKSKLVYRPTSLDAVSVLQSLVAHIAKDEAFLLPVARHGAGMISLQAFLLLLAFAEQRRKNNRNFILVAEEPELHLHPSLHHRLVHRIRATSNQSIVTTQSPNVAAGYQPHEVIFVQNNGGALTATPLRREPIRQITKNSVRKLYLAHRDAFYEALMGGTILVPEGIYDYEWLCLWQRLAQSAPETVASLILRPVTIVPTHDGAIIETYQEIARFRPDALPVVDGDNNGEENLIRLCDLNMNLQRIIRYGNGAAVECLAAWILEPALSDPGTTLDTLLSGAYNRTLKGLQDALANSTNKKDRDLRENLVWESLNNSECCERAGEFFHDIAVIASGESQHNPGWSVEIVSSGVNVYTANHIRRA